MHIGYNNGDVCYDMGGKTLKVVAEKDLGLLVGKDLKFPGHCHAIASKGTQILGMINRAFDCKQSCILVPLYKALVRPHLDYCSQAWNPHLCKDICEIEKVQRRATRMMMECKGKSYPERLKMVGITSLETRRRRADLIEVFKIVNNLHGLRFDDIFVRAMGITRGHNFFLRSHVS